LLDYKWISLKYYLDKEDQIKPATLLEWQHLPYRYVNVNNFFFLYSNFYNKTYNINILSNQLSSYKNNNLTRYSQKNDEHFLLLDDFPYLNNDRSYLTEFLYLKNSSFIKFFINNMIDVPICFKKSKSLTTKNFELPLLKFSNFLMKKGKKEKIIHIIFSAFRSFFKNQTLINSKKNNENLSFSDIYFLTNNFFWYYKNKNFFLWNFLNDLNFTLNYDNVFIKDFKTINFSYFIKNYFYFLISKTSPVFNFFIYSVDKNIRKYSRGRSGKYTFIWKYIAPYKRINFSMRGIIKDIKFYQNKKLNQRLVSVFELLLTNPDKSFSWKSKIFSHNYVFKNFRKSLMTSLRTTS